MYKTLVRSTTIIVMLITMALSSLAIAQDARAVNIANRICMTIQRQIAQVARVQAKIDRFETRIAAAQETLDTTDDDRVAQRAERRIRRLTRRIRSVNRIISRRNRLSEVRQRRYNAILATLDISPEGQAQVNTILANCPDPDAPAPTPVATPATPVATPATPVATPATPVATPATPVATPATPVATPVTTPVLPTPIATPIPPTPVVTPVPATPVPATPVPTPAAGIPDVAMIEAFPGLTFTQPVDFQSINDGSGRILVVEKPGRIVSFVNDPAVNTMKTVLDISGDIVSNGERGLLGLALHPDFVNNGRMFVNYTKAPDGATVIAEYQLDVANPDATATAVGILMEVAQPFANHNAGQLLFGPDGNLYITMGDGGAGGDPEGNGQNLTTLLGSLLRVNVDNGAPYTIPADNPFAAGNGGVRPEIYAYGLRNPWRFSFDSATGKLWLADVGQNAFEEINIIELGGNYGWNIHEGVGCFEADQCNLENHKPPVFQYGRDDGVSVTGGYVYRGSEIPALQGTYLFADFAFGTVWGLREENGTVTESKELLDTGINVATFGEDQNGEVYFTDLSDGKIYKIVASQ